MLPLESGQGSSTGPGAVRTIPYRAATVAGSPRRAVRSNAGRAGATTGRPPHARRYELDRDRRSAHVDSSWSALFERRRATGSSRSIAIWQTGSLHAAQAGPAVRFVAESRRYTRRWPTRWSCAGPATAALPAARGPRHLFATQAFIRAMNARQEWDLARADSELALAVSLIRGFHVPICGRRNRRSWEVARLANVVCARRAGSDGHRSSDAVRAFDGPRAGTDGQWSTIRRRAVFTRRSYAGMR